MTYSQANLTKFPTRQSFGLAIKQAFENDKSKVRVEHWAACLENHPQTGGVHYHCCVKLTAVKKWGAVRKFLKTKHDIDVNFSAKHDYYYSAYKYVIKDDADVVRSPGHPNLEEIGSPRTKASTIAYRRKRKIAKEQKEQQGTSSSTSAPQPAKRRLSNLDVSDFIVANKIHDRKELYSIANQRKNQGQCDLANFIFNRRDSQLDEIITKSWFMQNAESELADEYTPRMIAVRQCAELPCSHDDCDWLNTALEVLELNHLNPQTFSTYLRELLTEGRGKWRNLMLIGDSNCAKSFMFKPLKEIFGKKKVFENATNDKFTWVGADKAKIILLQDFRFDRAMISWNNLLLLLEGETVKLPAPKNHFASDVEIDTDIPIFATGKGKLKFKGAFNTDDERETNMMNSRWRYVELKHVFEEDKQKKVPPCGPCFSKLVLLSE